MIVYFILKLFFPQNGELLQILRNENIIRRQMIFLPSHKHAELSSVIFPADSSGRLLFQHIGQRIFQLPVGLKGFHQQQFIFKFYTKFFFQLHN